MSLLCTLCDGDRSKYGRCPRCRDTGHLLCQVCDTPAVSFDDRGTLPVCAGCAIDDDGERMARVVALSASTIGPALHRARDIAWAARARLRMVQS